MSNEDSLHEKLWAICITNPMDYDPWGNVKRWEKSDVAYPDCSGGCKFYYKLEDRGDQYLSNDWGVCGNPKSHRSGLLTFEHQGCQHAEGEDENDE